MTNPVVGDNRASGAEGYQRLHTLVTGRAASEAELRHVVRERAEAVVDRVARGEVTDPCPFDDLQLHMTLALNKRDTFPTSANSLDAVDRLTTYANACARLLTMARADKPAAPEPPKSAGYLSGSAEAGATKVGVGVGVGYGPTAEHGSYFIPAGPPPTLLPPKCECGQGFDRFAKSLTADAYVCPCGLQVGGEAYRAATGPLWPKYDGKDGFSDVNRSAHPDAIGFRAWLSEAKGGLVSPAAMKLKLKQMQADIDAKSKALEADVMRHIYASAEPAPVAPSLPPPKRDPYVQHRVRELAYAANTSLERPSRVSFDDTWSQATLNARNELATLRAEEAGARERAEHLEAVLAEHGEPASLKAEMVACAACGTLSTHASWADARAAGWRQDTVADGESAITCSDECALSAGGGE